MQATQATQAIQATQAMQVTQAMQATQAIQATQVTQAMQVMQAILLNQAILQRIQARILQSQLQIQTTQQIHITSTNIWHGFCVLMCTEPIHIQHYCMK